MYVLIATAQATTKTFALGVVPFDGTIESVEFIPNSAITGANTDTRKLSVINAGQAGAGTTVAAALQFDSGTNAAAFDVKTITNGVEANREVLEGDVLTVKSEAVGNGLADPGGVLIVKLSRADV